MALLCFSLPQILIMAIPFIKIFKNSIKHIAKVDLPVFKEFIIRAVKFGGFAFMALAVLQIDYFVMARTIDPVSITSYNIFNKVFIFAFFIYSSLLSAFWPVSSELFNNHNYVKLKNLLKNYTYIGILFMFLCIIFVYIFKNFIIKILAPDMFFTLNISFFILFSLYYILRVISDTYAMFLQSINVLKIFWIYTPVQAVISITAQYFLSIKYGINGIILGLILSFIFTSAWILPYKSYKIFKSKSNN
ncbi:MAG: MATE family efflux transporter [Endomicrobiaceae bacterium]|nr:MATE family efflux transporter [Endomicrobiaceae bacterium]